MILQRIKIKFAITLCCLYFVRQVHGQCAKRQFQNKRCDVVLGQCSGKKQLKMISCQTKTKAIEKESNCVQECCSVSAEQFTSHILSQCFDLGKQAVIIITVSVATVIIMTCCILNGVRKYLKNKKEPRVQALAIPKRIANEYHFDTTIQSTSVRKTEERIIQKDQNSTCSICLDPQVNCITNCEHRFHINCLANWHHKKSKCPLCNSNDLNDIRLFCVLCYKLIVLVQNLRVIQAQTQIQRKILCESCKSKEHVFFQEDSDYNHRKRRINKLTIMAEEENIQNLRNQLRNQSAKNKIKKYNQQSQI